ncbi:MAG: hypothetical protein GY740_20270 [Gammaproteobacteria bacterium]|nr:hypothetical protein [Gammaproteobacteria bacterium]
MECGKNYATPWTLRRHKEHIHPEEEDDDSETAEETTKTSEDDENSNDSNDDEESVDIMSIAEEVELVGELLREIIQDMACVASMDDLTYVTNYQKILEAFKEKVGYVLYQ